MPTPTPSKIDKILTTLGTNNSSQIATAVLAGFKMIFLPIATATDKTATPDQKVYTIIRDIIMEGLALVTYIGVTGQIQKHVTSPIVVKYFKNIADKIESGKIVPAEALTKEEKDILRNVKYKEIKEAGENFLTQISDNPKPITETTKDNIKKLTDIVKKINGDNTLETAKQTFEEYTNEIKGRTLNKASELISKDVKKATHSSQKVLEPLKVFQNTRISLSQLSVWILALAIIPPLCNAIIAPIMKKFAPKQQVKPANTTAVLPSFSALNKQTEKNTFSNFYNYFPNSTSTGMRV